MTGTATQQESARRRRSIITDAALELDAMLTQNMKPGHTHWAVENLRRSLRVLQANMDTVVRDEDQ